MAVLINLFLAVVGLRLGAGFADNALADSLANFSPMAALVICAALYFPSARSAFWVAFGALLVTDVALNLQWWAASDDVSLVSLFLGPSFLFRYAVYGLLFAVALGLRRRSKKGAAITLSLTLAGSFFFYLVTNTVAWATLPAYGPGLSSWFQALTVGLPGFPPTWVFFRNALIGDLGFALLFLASQRIPAVVRGPAILRSNESQIAQS
ncbi:MAG: DUF6580 family putative transport protein [Verrucomicrobiota bacterium]